MSLGGLVLRGVVLTSALSLSAAPALARDNPWGGTPWQSIGDPRGEGARGEPPQWGPLYEGAGFGEPGFGAYTDKGPEWDWDLPRMSGASSPAFLSPSRGQGFAPVSGTQGPRLEIDRDFRALEGPADERLGMGWQTPGAQPSSSLERPTWTPELSGEPGYRGEPRRHGFWHERTTPPANAMAVPGAPNYGYGPQQGVPGYRFRGDGPLGAGGWPSSPYAQGYRFRPLTEQERERLGQVPGSGSTYGPGVADPPFRRRSLTESEAAYGFEPSPWRAR